MSLDKVKALKVDELTDKELSLVYAEIMDMVLICLESDEDELQTQLNDWTDLMTEFEYEICNRFCKLAVCN